jgi:hypothetical protein
LKNFEITLSVLLTSSWDIKITGVKHFHFFSSKLLIYHLNPEGHNGQQANLLDLVLVTEGESRARITFAITVQGHHVTSTGNMTLVNILLLLVLFTQVSLLITNGNLSCSQRRVTTGGRLVSGVRATSCQVGPGDAHRVAVSDVRDEAGHGGVVVDLGGLGVEGAEAEDALEELPGAD